jgi:hypothetical protein
MASFIAAFAVGQGTWADWAAALGTWVVGVAAAAIAIAQFWQSKFRPVVSAYRDSEGRILVRIVNHGAGAGFVDEVNILPQQHEVTGRTEFYKWELWGKPSTTRPVPFPLSGGGSAQLILLPESDAPPESLRVRVEYGTGKDSGCCAITSVPTRLYGTTTIPGVIPSLEA